MQPYLLGDAPIVHDSKSPVGVLKIYDNQGKRFNICTGTLLRHSGNSAGVVLTARQCFVSRSDYGTYAPRAALKPEKVLFHKTHDGSGPGVRAKAIYLDERSDLAVVQLAGSIANVSGVTLSSRPVKRHDVVTSYGYGSPKQDPWQGLMRRRDSKTVVGLESRPEAGCGDLLFVGWGAYYNIYGDFGGPAIDERGYLVGVLTSSSQNVFFDTENKKHFVSSKGVNSSKWTAPPVIADFLRRVEKLAGVNFWLQRSYSWENAPCAGKREIVGASILSSSDPGGLWSAQVKDGKVIFIHPTIKWDKIAKPVVFNVRVCYLHEAGCTTEQHYILPKGWRRENALNPGKRIFAGNPKAWISVVHDTQWATNDEKNNPPTYDSHSDYYSNSRIAGGDRVDTSVRAFQDARFAQNAVLVNGANYPDAVVAAPLAASYQTGILLTVDRRGLERDVLDTLRRQGVKNVLIVGSQGSVSVAKEQQLRSMGIRVTRLGGNDRYATSVSVANHLKSRGAGNWVFLADGSGFADALAAGAAAGLHNGYVLLTRVKQTGKGLVDDSPSAVKKLASGRYGTLAVGGRAFAAGRNWGKVTAIAGSDRYETAVILARAFGGREQIVAASGQDFPDALAASPLVVAKRGSLVLMPKQGLTTTTVGLLWEYKPDRVTVVGGRNSIPVDVLNRHLKKAEGRSAIN
ncbi:cell wall-binding repeat-containing protein [Buchananella felis]|uniref:cell wall-binding repeat-containing protein n=1 Tax=Buchananella felis TaxID=3231492 RepID=UPI00352906DE